MNAAAACNSSFSILRINWCCLETRYNLANKRSHTLEISASNYDDLSGFLKPIVEIELTLGNKVDHIYRPSGSACPLEVVFKSALHREEINKVGLPFVWYAEEHAPQYGPPAGGYKCVQTNHAVSGPLPNS